MSILRKRYAEGQVVTGLLYIDDDELDLHGVLNTTERPLNAVSPAELCPGRAALDALNKSFR